MQMPHSAFSPEQELALLGQQHEALLRAIAHDLRAPLRHIQSFAPLLQEAVHTLAAAAPQAQEAAADALEFSQFMQQSAHKLAQMVQALTALSQAVRRPLQPQPVEAVALCQQLAAAHTPQALLVLPAQPVWLQADPQALADIVQELLANAQKFAAAQPLQLHLQAQPQGGCWQLALHDNGVGFDASLGGPPMLFQPFARMHRESEFPGLGCGLAQVQALAQRHGAQASISAQPGQGCVVTLLWPAAGVDRD